MNAVTHPRSYRTSFGLEREDALRTKLNACRAALADRQDAIATGGWNAIKDANAAYDAAIAAAQQEYEATTESAWNEHDARKAA